nr:MAG TPA: hypothetical protein [Caudoviricetes sp.]
MINNCIWFYIYKANVIKYVLRTEISRSPFLLYRN